MAGSATEDTLTTSSDVKEERETKKEQENVENGGDSSSTSSSELPQEVQMKHPLQHTWCLWYMENNRTRKWEDNLVEITSVDTVEDFWSLYNHVKLLSEMKSGTDFNLFKKGIKPMWEDQYNKRGGKWMITLDKYQRHTEFDRLWLDMLLCLIGEVFDHPDEICGAVASIRGKGDKICVWTRSSQNKAANLQIGQNIRDRMRLPPNMKIQYVLHNDTSANSKHGTPNAIYEL
ncbi:eukaryotic translation initiation factor 4E-1A [Phlebotomus papatasi]|uniref:eukaryotic translation initiation factor 4E-1A n=1 Tax=Phlebotomus papatasi TaxID=29031 RepID=UPI00248441B1|nr:eukaryotic translation initiation factor 4E-1A [Phlebotomus papatasi]